MFKDIILILGKPHLTVYRKCLLLLTIFKLRLKRYLSARLIPFNPKVTSFLGFTVYHENLNDFYWTFRDVFLEEGYYFDTSDTSPILFDCGANIGMTTLYFFFLYPNAHVTAFEPEKTNLSFLKKNITENNLVEKVTIVEKAVSDREGVISLYGEGRAVTVSKTLFDMEKETKDSYNSTDTETASVVKLSKYLPESVTFLKLDIEGAEQDVIQELSESGTLKRIQTIVIEYHYFGTSNRLTTILSLLEKNGFMYKIDYGPLTLDTMISSNYYHYMINAQKNE